MRINRKSAPETARDHPRPAGGTPGSRGVAERLSFRKPARFLGGAVAAVMAVASVAGGLLAGSAGPAGAATTIGWVMGAGNVQRLDQRDHATASHFLNTPGSYAAGGSLVQSPVLAGYAATPLLTYTSYSEFRSDIQSGSITYPYAWVMYDPEKWWQTPVDEQQSPAKYMTLFGQLAHAHGLKVIQAPALDLAYVAGSVSPRQPRETASQWYVRANMAAAAAAAGDIYLLQDESNTARLAQYDSLFGSAKSQARAANPGVRVFSEVSAVNGSGDQMAAAAKSVSADGFYVAAPGDISRAVRFFQIMRNAGY
jgi:hypothetical protein